MYIFQKRSLNTLALIILSNFCFSQFSFYRNDSLPVSKSGKNMDLSWAGGLISAQFSSVDINLDGIKDIFVFDKKDNKALIFLNNGSLISQLKYAHHPEFENKIPKLNSWVLLRDFNCDGKEDIFTYNKGGVMVYKNNSNNNLNFELQDSLLTYTPPSSAIIFISSDDIPAIDDVDGDGDLDILTFGLTGQYMDYYQNMSMENYGTCDSLVFELKNNCWGHFSESGINTNKLILFDTCSNNISNPRNIHSGSTVTTIDIDNNGVKDILIGDVSYNNIVLGINGGSLVNSNSSITIQDTAFPNNNNQIDLAFFPATYYQDIDNDNIKDLIVTPNSSYFVENTNNILVYKNSGTNTLPNFNLLTKSFLQEFMINVGEDAKPTLFDYNSDGLLDLLISNYGYFNKEDLDYNSKITLYENIGTLNNPEFDYITDNYQNISTYNLGVALRPTFGDLNNDGDIDMVLGDADGNIHILENTAGMGNTATYILQTSNIQDHNNNTIDVGQFAEPQLFDFDKDGDLDLIIGKKRGTISYYENIGSPNNYLFKLITDTMGGVFIRETWDINGASTGYSSPFLYENNNEVYLFCGSQRGDIYLFDSINTNPTDNFVIKDTIIHNNVIGLHLKPIIYDLNNDSNPDMIIGNARGGLSFFSGKKHTSSITYLNNKTTLTIFPNPAKNTLNIYTNTKQKRITIKNIIGKTMFNKKNETFNSKLSITNIPNGMYFCTIYNTNGTKTSKPFIIAK